MANLIFLSGAEPGSTASLNARTRLGRGPECEIRLEDEQVSRIHSCIYAQDDRWVLEDCGSLNGTLVNSCPTDRTPLNSGDLIRVGDTLLLFCAEVNSDAEKHAIALSDQSRVRRIIGVEKRRIADDPIGSDSTSGPVRKLSCLYRLSKQSFQATNQDTLLRYSASSIQQVLNSQEARICLRTASGQFRVYSTAAEEHTENDGSNVFASWVVEKDEALLLDLNENVSWRGENESVEKGTCLAVPIPGADKPLGAIECFQPEDNRAFRVPDLEFLISVGQHLGLAIESLAQRERIRAANENLRARLNQTRQKLIGECPSMAKLRSQISRVAQSDITVLVRGESGTGKEVVSQMVHELSGRKDGPLITVNCAAFTDSLLESELFGHEKGSFTGADKRRKGKFEAANGGTIFLDEVGELSQGCQAKLLRLLEGMPFQRVGGNESIEVDVRIVAATHRDLEKMVKEGRFRQDLWFRLRVMELEVPPLRNRGNDKVDLAEQFLIEFAQKRGNEGLRLSEDSLEAIKNHRWPGNVRELRNSIERAVVLANGPEIVPEELGIAVKFNAPLSTESLVSLKQLEQAHVISVLETTNGNKTKACRILGITRAALYNKLARMELEKDAV